MRKPAPIRIEFMEKKQTSGPTLLLAWIIAIMAVLAFISPFSEDPHYGKKKTADVPSQIAKDVH